jgi:hypothetical protein
MKRILIIAFLLAGLLLAVAPALAQDFNEITAVEIAASSYPFAEGLAIYPGWTAAAYDPGTRYQQWRVNFWAADGEALGWANVSALTREVTFYDVHFYPSNAQEQDAYEAVPEFLNTTPEIQSTIGSLDDYEYWIGYDAWMYAWTIWINDGVDSLYGIVRFGEDGMPWQFDDPELVALIPGSVLEYEEWYESNENQAIALAYQLPEISETLAGVSDWHARGWPEEGSSNRLWIVEFTSGENVLATAWVDMSTMTAGQ